MVITMDFKSLLPVIEKAAPVLANIIGGPAASVGASLIASIFGGDPKSPEDLLKRITVDPEAQYKLAQLENQHIEALTVLASKDYSTEVDDRKDARQQEISYLKNNGKRDWLIPVLALLAVTGFLFSMAIILFTQMDKSDHDVLYTMIGQLSMIVVMIYQKYFPVHLPLEFFEKTFGKKNMLK